MKSNERFELCSWAASFIGWDGFQIGTCWDDKGMPIFKKKNGDWHHHDLNDVCGIVKEKLIKKYPFADLSFLGIVWFNSGPDAFFEQAREYDQHMEKLKFHSDYKTRCAIAGFPSHLGLTEPPNVLLFTTVEDLLSLATGAFRTDTLLVVSFLA